FRQSWVTRISKPRSMYTVTFSKTLTVRMTSLLDCLVGFLINLVAYLWRDNLRLLKLVEKIFLPKQNVAGSIPVTRSGLKSITYENTTERKSSVFRGFATKRSSSVTRRNPPFSELGRSGLWRACGESDSSKR